MAMTDRHVRRARAALQALRQFMIRSTAGGALACVLPALAPAIQDGAAGAGGAAAAPQVERLPLGSPVPPIYDTTQGAQAPRTVDADPRSADGDASRAEPNPSFDERGLRKQLQELRQDCFARHRKPEARREGIARLSEFTDWRGFQAMHEELAKEADDVRLAMLDHFGAHGGPGQAALAWVAIHDRDAAIRNEATRRIQTPACNEVLAVLDGALRCRNHRIANSAGMLAGNLSVLPAIPLLIMAQVAQDPVEQQGDLAWIAIGTQQAYVANAIPVVGDESGAFQPVIGTLLTGVVMRVSEAVATTYRSDAHAALVNMTTLDWGQSTASLGWSPARWAQWYNEEYVPFKQAQAGSRPSHPVP